MRYRFHGNENRGKSSPRALLIGLLAAGILFVGLILVTSLLTDRKILRMEYLPVPAKASVLFSAAFGAFLTAKKAGSKKSIWIILFILLFTGIMAVGTVFSTEERNAHAGIWILLILIGGLVGGRIGARGKRSGCL